MNPAQIDTTPSGNLHNRLRQPQPAHGHPAGTLWPAAIRHFAAVL